MVNLKLPIVHYGMTRRDMMSNKRIFCDSAKDDKEITEALISFFLIKDVNQWLDMSYKDFMESGYTLEEDFFLQSHKFDNIPVEKKLEYEFYHKCKYRNFNMFMMQYWGYQHVLYYIKRDMLHSQEEVENNYDVLYYNGNENLEYGILNRPIKLTTEPGGIPIDVKKMTEDNMGTPIRLFKLSDTEFETLEEIPSYYIL